MSELSPRAKALIAAGKGGMEPTTLDQARVLDGLRARLSQPDPAPAEGATSLPPAPRPLWPLVSVGTVGAGLLAGLAFWALSAEPPPPSAPPSHPVVEEASPPPTAPETLEQVTPNEPPATVTPAVGADGPSTPPTAKPRNRLAEEVAILARATTALHAGRAQDALQAAAEHQQKFPGGALTEERVAVRAQALCLLGRTEDAERELGHLSPSSPQAARARQRCGLK